jgi:hypothetical protein
MEHVDAIVRGEPPHAPDRMISVKVASDLWWNYLNFALFCSLHFLQARLMLLSQKTSW